MAYVEVDLAAVRRNYRMYAENGTVIPVLKRDAYGMGLLPVAEALYSEGARLFGCGSPSEALTLARAGYDALLLCCVHDVEELRRLARAGVILAIESLEQAQALAAPGVKARVHIAVDTGFGRFGFLPAQVDDIRRVCQLPGISVRGIFSHIGDQRRAGRQLSAFTELTAQLDDCELGIRHIASTAYALRPDYRLDAVRVGTGLTGRGCTGDNAVSFKARVLSVRTLRRGATVGYDAHTLWRGVTAAVIDAGYGDGAFIQRARWQCGALRNLLSRRPHVLVNGVRCPVLGRPGLTSTVIDVSKTDCAPGDVVTIDQTPVLIPENVNRHYLEPPTQLRALPRDAVAECVKPRPLVLHRPAAAIVQT